MITHIKIFTIGMMTMALFISLVLNYVLISVRFETLPEATVFGYNLHQQKYMNDLTKELKDE